MELVGKNVVTDHRKIAAAADFDPDRIVAKGALVSEAGTDRSQDLGGYQQK